MNDSANIESHKKSTPLIERPVVIGLSPNTQIDDYLKSALALFAPWNWKRGKSVDEVSEWFKENYQTETVLTFNAGRSALLAILESFGIGHNDEILVQAFTCVAVPNSIIWTHAKPIYVDIDDTLNIDISNAARRITPKTKALIVQHTFGIPANMEAIVAFCKKHSLLLIEDCAHALGATYNDQKIGTFGDAVFFSFGRDKVISSVFGGVAILPINSKYAEKLKSYHQSLKYPSYFWIWQQIWHPLLCALVLVLYNFLNIGKFLLWLFQKLHFLSFPVYKEEKISKRPKYFPAKFPNALSYLAFNQLEKLNIYNERRREIAAMYFSYFKKSEFRLPVNLPGAVYLRFNLLSHRSDQIRFLAKKQKFILGNWYHNIIDPRGVNFTEVNYEEGSCPKAEKAARMSINLPTYPTLSDHQVRQICALMEKE